ncbi:hypothetical protein HELRODRAFT_174896 [Helobdella robusta]|uniref:Ras-GEF domain-containing protein n=1 Tax=Helobdella robusta TaxID=6412 RepID=T1F8L2_HELRO|nr:hypothetical protein HELRODRAFT_174896 [Helobdella robusta]ESO01341.1 hypothetical protein HELRODRAFT_174896 [Helobdella robusta]
MASKKRESVISTFATMRVLNVLRHWVTKHCQDFDMDKELKDNVNDLLEEMLGDPTLLPVEYKAANVVSLALNKADTSLAESEEMLQKILTPPTMISDDSLESLAALDIAEQMTYIDHKIFSAINSSVGRELLGQAWMKPEKSCKAQHVLLASRLVVSEIIRRQTINERVACIEKWAAIADICRCINNFNGVLQVCAAFVNSSIYRLKKTWDKLPKQTRQMIDKLQSLVSADGRCDPPCIPYLGIYLTDLSFIEEGTPNVTENGLVNFSKMRMIAHVIQEIKTFQQTPYKIEFQRRVADYLLDSSRLIDDDQTFKFSLEMEPRNIRVSIPTSGMM